MSTLAPSPWRRGWCGLLPRPVAGAVEALSALRELGVTLAIISNTGRTPGTVLRVLMGNMGILEYFDATTFSNEILVRKPSEGAFTVTLEKLEAGWTVTAFYG